MSARRVFQVTVMATASVLVVPMVGATNFFDSEISSGEESLREMGRYVSVTCAGGTLSNTNADAQLSCDNLVIPILSGTPVEKGQAIAGLGYVNTEESSGFQNSTGDVRNAQAGFGGRAGLSSAVRVAGNYNVPGAFGWSSGAAGDGASAWEFFLNGLYTYSDKDPTLLESGFESDDYGVTAGFGYNLSETLLLGFALGYVENDADVDLNAGSLDSSTMNYTFYGSFYPNDNLYFDGMITYSRTDHDQVRNLNYVEAAGVGSAVINQRMASETESKQLAFSLTGGYNFYGENIQSSVYARVDYGDVEIDGYSESASAPTARGNGLALRIDGQDFDSLTTTAGLSFSGQWGSDVRPWYPYALVEFMHEFKNDNDPLVGQFIADPDPSNVFRLPTDRPDRNYFNVGVGTSVALTDRTFGFLRYQVLIGYRDLMVHAVELGLRQSF